MEKKYFEKSASHKAIVRPNATILDSTTYDGPQLVGGPQLPSFPVLGEFIKRAYREAYIGVKFLPDQYNPNKFIDFDHHISNTEFFYGIGWNNSIDTSESATFWTAPVIMAYQGDISESGDGKDVPWTNGATPNGRFEAPFCARREPQRKRTRFGLESRR